MIVHDSTFGDNHAGSNGGVINGYNLTSVGIHNNSFSNNRASINGGVSYI